MYFILNRKLLLVCMYVCGYLIVVGIFVKLIKWLFFLFIKDSYLFDLFNFSFFISGYCCELVLDENSLIVMLLYGGCFI